MVESKCNRDPYPAASFIFKQKKTIIPSKKKQIFRDLNIYFAIIDYLSDFSLFPPPESLETIRALFSSKRFGGQMVKGEPIPKPFMNFFKDVDGMNGMKIKIRVSGQHFIIKPFDIKTDNRITC